MEYIGLLGLFGLIGLIGLVDRLILHLKEGDSLMGLLGFIGLGGFWFSSLGALEHLVLLDFTIIRKKICQACIFWLAWAYWSYLNFTNFSLEANTSSPAQIARFFTKFCVSCALLSICKRPKIMNINIDYDCCNE